MREHYIIENATECYAALCRACHRTLKGIAVTLSNRFTVKICPECRSILVHPLPSESQISKIYNSKNYYRATSESRKSGYKVDYLSFQKTRRLEYSQLLSWIETGASRGLLLELGCAFGLFIHLAKQRGWKTLGIELSLDAATYAREQLDLNVIHGDISLLSDVEVCPSVIVMLDLIEHLRSPDAALQVCHDRLSDEGVLAIRTPDASSLTARRGGIAWAQITPPDHLTLYSRSGLYDALRRHGFRPISWRRAGGLGLGRHLTRSQDLGSGPRNTKGISQQPIVYNLARMMARSLDRGDMMEILARKVSKS